jgi:hypothetical protein
MIYFVEIKIVIIKNICHTQWVKRIENIASFMHLLYHSHSWIIHLIKNVFSIVVCLMNKALFVYNPYCYWITFVFNFSYRQQ